MTHSPSTYSQSTEGQPTPSVADVPDPNEQAAQRRAFGSRLRSIRNAAGLTQEQLAHLSELDRTYIGAVENGRRNLSLHAMWQLASALQTSPDQFFTAHETAQP